MAINTLPVFTANSPSAPWEPAFVVSYPHDGIVYVAGFSSIYELTNLLVAECIEGRLVEQIIDFAEESLEWSQPEYPLFQPPDVVDEPGPCQCDACTNGRNAQLIAELRSDMRSQRRSVGWILVAIGLVAWFVR